MKSTGGTTPVYVRKESKVRLDAKYLSRHSGLIISHRSNAPNNNSDVPQTLLQRLWLFLNNKNEEKKISKSDFHLTFGLILKKVIYRETLLKRSAFIVLEFVAMHCIFDTETEQVAIKAFYHIVFLCVTGNRYSGKLLVIALYDALSTGIANKLSLFCNIHKQKACGVPLV